MSADVAQKLATIEDLKRLDPDGRYEILGGLIVEKASPTGEHGGSQGEVIVQVSGPYNRRSGGSGGPGGWWIAVEVDIQLEPHEVIRPDIAGWRRDRVPERPTGFPVFDRPDWVCEVLSPSTARRDLGEKMRLLHRHEVPWYWVVDPQGQFVQVLRHTPDGYLIERTASPGDRPRLSPFEAVEFDVGRFFGIESDEADQR